MIDHNEVVNVIRTELQKLDKTDLDRFRWENRAIDPPDSAETYVEERFLVVTEGPIGSDYDRLIAEMHYTVLAPRGQGTEGGRTLARNIKALFKAGRGLVGQIVVIVESSEILSGRVRDETRYAFPVVVAIRVDANRNEGV